MVKRKRVVNRLESESSEMENGTEIEIDIEKMNRFFMENMFKLCKERDRFRELG